LRPSQCFAPFVSPRLHVVEGAWKRP
jgi:hypothetical protein